MKHRWIFVNDIWIECADCKHKGVFHKGHAYFMAKECKATSV